MKKESKTLHKTLGILSNMIQLTGAIILPVALILWLLGIVGSFFEGVITVVAFIAVGALFSLGSYF